MKLEDQVCSLELSKHLKVIGVKQDGYFSWFETKKYGCIIKESNYSFDLDHYLSVCKVASAFTIGELGEMLPYKIQVTAGKDSFLDSYKNDKQWMVSYFRNYNDPVDLVYFSEKEADARAQMLIYLIDNKLYIPKEK